METPGKATAKAWRSEASPQLPGSSVGLRKAASPGATSPVAGWRGERGQQDGCGAPGVMGTMLSGLSPPWRGRLGAGGAQTGTAVGWPHANLLLGEGAWS